jgi:hypothetical protein
MINVLHRTRGTTAPYIKDFRKGVDAVRYPVEDWIHSPDLTGLEAVDKRYWDINGDVVTLVDEATQQARDDECFQLATAADKEDAKNKTDYRLMAILDLMVDEINILRQAAGLKPARTLEDYKQQIRQRIDTL